MIKSAWDFGWQAYYDNKDRDQNPYNKGHETILYDDWLSGWETAYDAETKYLKRVADRVDGYDRDDLGYSGDY